MVYDTQNYWVFGLFPSSRIVENRKHDVSETGSVSVFRWGWKTPTQLGTLERATLQVQWLRLAQLRPLERANLQVQWLRLAQLGPLERANIQVQWLRLVLYKGPNWVGVFCHSPEDGNRSSFRNVVFSIFYNTGRWKKSKNPVILYENRCSGHSVCNTDSNLGLHEEGTDPHRMWEGDHEKQHTQWQELTLATRTTART
jgi:hypothetical protein